MKHHYFKKWLKALSLQLWIGVTIIAIQLLFFIVLIDFEQKIYRISCFIPKYGLIITNQKKYPYNRKDFRFWKWKHIYLMHLEGTHARPLARGNVGEMNSESEEDAQ